MVQRGVGVAHLGAEGPGTESQQDRETDDNRRVAEPKEEADRHRTLPFRHELARGVVDRRDVVRVKGVAHAQEYASTPVPTPNAPLVPRL